MGEGVGPTESLLGEAGVALAEVRACWLFRQRAVSNADETAIVDIDLLARSRHALARSRARLGTAFPYRHIEQEFADLKEANRHIAHARMCIRRQQRKVDDLIRRGHPVAMAEDLLDTMITTLNAMDYHRRTILERLGPSVSGRASPSARR
jgi:hypothetical protein